MFNSKYSNVLTILLVIVILAILGLLIFLGIDVYTKYYITKEAGEAVDKFENIISNTIIENNVTNDVVDNSPINDVLNELQNTTQPGGNNNNQMMYKGYVMKGTIKIPKTNIEYPVLERVTKKSIEVAVAIQYGPGLNQKGNTVIIGHNYRNGLFFSNNKKLENGDKIYIKDESGKTLTYTIYNKYETTPEDTTYMQRDTADRIEISLSTCTDDNAKRLIIWAKADET